MRFSQRQHRAARQLGCCEVIAGPRLPLSRRSCQQCVSLWPLGSLWLLSVAKVNRLLVKRMTVAQAWNEMTLSLVAGFFLTTFPTNMLKFPVFEVINRAMAFSGLPASISGTISGFFFCTIMLPVTNYRFRKSMGWEIKASLLYQAYVWHSKRKNRRVALRSRQVGSICGRM